jgi:hypothetical protein
MLARRNPTVSPTTTYVAVILDVRIGLTAPADQAEAAVDAEPHRTDADDWQGQLRSIHGAEYDPGAPGGAIVGDDDSHRAGGLGVEGLVPERADAALHQGDRVGRKAGEVPLAEEPGERDA